MRVAGTVVELGGARDFPVDWLAFVEVFTGAGYTADERVDCLFVEWHAPTAGCTLEELVRVVEASGLELAGQSGTVLRFQSRPRSEPSQP